MLVERCRDFVNKIKNEEFEVLTEAVMKSSVFWDITPCSPEKVDRHFGFLPALCWFLAWLTFRS
jgi:hypothetical protein